MAKGFAGAMMEEGQFNLGNDKADMKYWISHKNFYKQIGNDNDPSKGVNSVNFALAATHGAFDFKDLPQYKMIEYHYYMVFGTNDCFWLNAYSRFGENGCLKWVVIDGCNSLQLPPPNQGIIGTERYPNSIPETIYQDVNPKEIWHQSTVSSLLVKY
jgi:hypothetical protein